MLAVLVLILTAATATLPAGEAPVPMAEETYHRPVFENRYAAVYDVVLPPGALMRYHAHPTDHLAVVIDGGTLRNEVIGAPATERATGPGGTVVFIPAGPAHRQANIGAKPVHFVAAEVLAAAPADKAVDPSLPRRGCEVAQLNLVIVAWRCHVPPGARLTALPAGIPALRVAIGRAVVGIVGPQGTEDAATFAPGAVTWFDGDVTADLVNRGAAAFDLVEVAWRPQARPIPRTADVPKNPGDQQ